MMKIENQVCSLEHAKELKELGVKQDSSWYWVERWNPHKFIALKNDWTLTTLGRIAGRTCYSAFTVAELGELLKPQNKDDVIGDFHLDMLWNHKRDGFDIILRVNDSYKYDVRAITEANVRAKMLIYLLKEGLVKP